MAPGGGLHSLGSFQVVYVMRIAVNDVISNVVGCLSAGVLWDWSCFYRELVLARYHPNVKWTHKSSSRRVIVCLHPGSVECRRRRRDSRSLCIWHCRSIPSALSPGHGTPAGSRDHVLVTWCLCELWAVRGLDESLILIAGWLISRVTRSSADHSPLTTLEVDRISASVSVSSPNVNKWALSADTRFRPKAVVPHSMHFRFRRAAVGTFGGCRK